MNYPIKNKHSRFFLVIAIVLLVQFFLCLPALHANTAKKENADNAVDSLAKQGANSIAIIDNSIIALVPGGGAAGKLVKVPLPFYDPNKSTASETYLNEQLLPELTKKGLKYIILNHDVSDADKLAGMLKAAGKSNTGVNKLAGYLPKGIASKLKTSIAVTPGVAGGAKGVSPLVAKITKYIPPKLAGAVTKAAPFLDKAGKVAGFAGLAFDGYSEYNSLKRVSRGIKNPNNPKDVVSYTIAKHNSVYGGIETGIDALGMVPGPVGIGFTLGKLSVDGIVSMMGGKGGFFKSMKRYSTQISMYDQFNKYANMLEYMVTPTGRLNTREMSLSSKDLSEFRAMVSKYKPPQRLLAQLVLLKDFYYRAGKIAGDGGTLDDAAINKILMDIVAAKNGSLEKQITGYEKRAKMNNIDLDIKTSDQVTQFNSNVNKFRDQLEKGYNDSRNHVGPWGEAKFNDTGLGRCFDKLSAKVREKNEELVNLKTDAKELKTQIKEKEAEIKEKAAQAKSSKDPDALSKLTAEITALTAENEKRAQNFNKMIQQITQKQKVVENGKTFMQNMASSYPGGNSLVNINL